MKIAPRNFLQAAHSSTPQLGVNAILSALAWAKSSGTPVMAARGGSSSNVVPASCTWLLPVTDGHGRVADFLVAGVSGQGSDIYGRGVGRVDQRPDHAVAEPFAHQH